MKILQLNLFAFGPFNNTLLDLSKGQEGLHIIYGPNEAGKSSALRALRQMLYGIPDRSPDDFIHPYPKLRIGGILRRKDGRIMEFIRRKGRINTLRAADDTEPVEETQLRTFMGGADETLFNTMFGIDHEGLVKGGEEIIQGGGDVGQILFAAGSGISDFRKIQNDLQTEADALFKPAGIKPRINETISRFKTMQKAVRDAQLPGQDWEQHETALRKAEKEKQSIETELEQKIRERGRLERIRDALPAIARRTELSAALKDAKGFNKPLEAAIILPDDFGEKRREALTHLRVAENQAQQSAKSAEAIHQALQQLNVPENIIRNAELIRRLYKETGSYQKAMDDRLRLEGLKSSAYAEAKNILKELRDDLPLEQAEHLRLKKAERVRIQELGREYERLISRKQSIREEIIRLSSQIERLNKQLAAIGTPKDVTELRQAVENIRQHGNLEAQYQAEWDKIQKAQADAEMGLKKLTLWKGSLEDLESLPIPSVETIESFEHRFQDIQRIITQCRANTEELEHDLLKINGQIEHIRLEREVPTENDLYKAREERDQQWRLIIGQDAGRKAQYAGGAQHSALSTQHSALIHAYESSVRHADTLADRLRREADRVAKKAALLSDYDTRNKRLSRLKEQLETAEANLKQVQAEWKTAWRDTGISPESPREMRAWVQKQTALANQSAMIREQHAKTEILKSAIETHCRELSQCLKCLGVPSLNEDESLLWLLNRSQQIAERFENIRNRQEALLADLEQRENEKQETEQRAEKTNQELQEWRFHWMKAIERLGLDADTTPAQANAVTDDLKTLFEKLKDADILRKRIRGIDRDAEELTEKIRHLTEQIASDLKEFPVEHAVSELNARLTQALTANTQKQSLEKQRMQEEKQLKQAEIRIAEIQAQLSVMCETAGCETYDQLPLAEERSARRRELEQELKQIDAQLHKFSGGIPLEMFIQQVQAIDPDIIEPEISRFSEAIEHLGQQKSVLDQTIGSERTELARMDGNAKAAELAEASQDILAHLETDVEQYARLRLASVVLNQAIERYREKHQGPILKRSNDLFCQMTRNSFEGLRLEFNDKGDTVLVGVRSGGKDIVHVEGMSEGTADQLYLAVRLASLEAYLKKNEPLPFIIDDILIKFDDDRAIATLKILARLSEKTQVIFFTHHQHLTELAAQHIDDDILFVNFLDRC